MKHRSSIIKLNALSKEEVENNLKLVGGAPALVLSGSFIVSIEYYHYELYRGRYQDYLQANRF